MAPGSLTQPAERSGGERGGGRGPERPLQGSYRRVCKGGRETALLRPHPGAPSRTTGSTQPILGRAGRSWAGRGVRVPAAAQEEGRFPALHAGTPGREAGTEGPSQGGQRPASSPASEEGGEYRPSSLETPAAGARGGQGNGAEGSWQEAQAGWVGPPVPACPGRLQQGRPCCHLPPSCAVTMTL